MEEGGSELPEENIWKGERFYIILVTANLCKNKIYRRARTYKSLF